MAEGVEEYHLWAVDQLKTFLRGLHSLQLETRKTCQKVVDIVYTDRLEEEIEASPFQSVEYLATSPQI